MAVRMLRSAQSLWPSITRSGKQIKDARQQRSKQRALHALCSRPYSHRPLDSFDGAPEQARIDHARQRPLVGRDLGSLNGAIELDSMNLGQSRIILDLTFLRDSCSCPRCVDPSTKQKLFDTASIPPELEVAQYEWFPEQKLDVWWQNDIPGFEDHCSTFTAGFLAANSSVAEHLRFSRANWPFTAWNRAALLAQLPKLSFLYEDYITSTEALRSVISGLRQYGITFIRSVPQDREAVKEIARKIGPLRQSFYGDTWDVKSVPSAKNVAYTAQELGFHMDLLYMRDPPGLQFLHCLKATPKGGLSRFSDALAAFNALQREDPDSSRALVSQPITFHYHNDGQWYRCERPFVEGGVRPALQDGSSLVYPLDFDAINWSPPFQGPFAPNTERRSLKAYVHAANSFRRRLEHEQAVFETKLGEGTCVIFDNRRIVHARTAFDPNDGDRWLRGCYVDTDCFHSQARTLENSVAAG